MAVHSHPPRKKFPFFFHWTNWKGLWGNREKRKAKNLSSIHIYIHTYINLCTSIFTFSFILLKWFTFVHAQGKCTRLDAYCVFIFLYVWFWYLFVVSQLPDDVGASPIDIARAYMVNRISEAGFGSKSLNTKDEGALIHDNLTALKPSSPSPSPKARYHGTVSAWAYDSTKSKREIWASHFPPNSLF